MPAKRRGHPHSTISSRVGTLEQERVLYAIYQNFVSTAIVQYINSDVLAKYI